LEIDDMFKAYKRLYNQEPKFLIFDEVQNIPQWQKVLRTFHDRRKYKIIVTGSSSKLHTDEISTELRGRYTHTLLLPFSFSEYLAYKKLTISELERTYDTDQIYIAFQDYMQYGGFPVVVSTDPLQKRELLNEYYATIYHRDVIERNNIRDKNQIERFMKYVLNMYSSQFSISKLETYWKSEGTKISKTTLAKYLSYLKEAFFTIPCFKFGYSTKVQLANPIKLYLIDSGFIRL
jgi:predicted AAA+ superfamily ATPase